MLKRGTKSRTSLATFVLLGLLRWLLISKGQSLGVGVSKQPQFSVLLRERFRALFMKPESPPRSPMSRHGKSKLLDAATPPNQMSVNSYDFDGLLSTPRQTEIKTSTTLPALPSLECNYSETTWMAQAACKGLTKKFFHHSCTNRCDSHKDGCHRVKSVRECRNICSGCAVLEHCRVWALHSDLPAGYVAGMTENQRQKAQRLLGVSVEQHYV